MNCLKSLNIDWQGQSVGLLVAQQPMRAQVFERLGIDFCCGGAKSLAEACRLAAVDPLRVIEELKANDMGAAQSDVSRVNWLSESLTALADHIEETHHRYLNAELPRLLALAEKVARVHGVREPRLKELQSVFTAMQEELLEHTAAEEAAVFPLIRRLEAGTVGDTDLPLADILNQLQNEHQEAAQSLLMLRQLSNNYTPPGSACASWLALLDGLAKLDLDLRTHVHKENSILFPRVREALELSAPYPDCTVAK